MTKPLSVIGRAEVISLPNLSVFDIPARVDTGARTSALWASNIVEDNGMLQYSLFGAGSEYYTGNIFTTRSYGKRLVANSTGHIEERYTIKLATVLHGRKIRTTFTLANRSTQVYPVLLGRNILRGKFVVDVTLGQPLVEQEQQREANKRKLI